MFVFSLKSTATIEEQRNLQGVSETRGCSSKFLRTKLAVDSGANTTSVVLKVASKISEHFHLQSNKNTDILN